MPRRDGSGKLLSKYVAARSPDSHGNCHHSPYFVIMRSSLSAKNHSSANMQSRRAPGSIYAQRVPDVGRSWANWAEAMRFSASPEPTDAASMTLCELSPVASVTLLAFAKGPTYPSISRRAMLARQANSAVATVGTRRRILLFARELTRTVVRTTRHIPKTPVANL